ncbi:histidine kinase [Mucilaginibacter gracilis]|uniref:Histidine kinase n=1 Tax=Mucilaginibacter gracilis TaxID=423350 RepID=A0A495IWV9_9SPHI|nr:histidine kinase [Mucilaginibacter gracilis]
MLWLVTSRNPESYYTYILVSLILQILGSYTGRWLYINWFRYLFVIRFIAYSVIALTFLTLIGAIGFSLISPDQAHDVKYLIKYLLISFFTVLPSIIIGVFLTMTRDALRQQINEAVTARRQNESELTLLKSQLSPHFLFNTLNNLYGLSITKQPDMPALLLRLSDLLRYSLYQTTDNFVSLNDELTYINNYIELEKIRVGNRLNLSRNINSLLDRQINIAPMLLIVFVENAFKHATNTFNHEISIAIDLRIENDTIHFNISNSVGTEKKPNSTINSGLGIATTKKRLELLYPNQYSLVQELKENRYETQLTIKAK